MEVWSVDAAPVAVYEVGDGAEAVGCRLAGAAEPYQQDYPADKRDEAHEVPAATFADVVEASPAQAERRQQHYQIVKAESGAEEVERLLLPQVADTAVAPSMMLIITLKR